MAADRMMRKMSAGCPSDPVARHPCSGISLQLITLHNESDTTLYAVQIVDKPSGQSSTTKAKKPLRSKPLGCVLFAIVGLLMLFANLALGGAPLCFIITGLVAWAIISVALKLWTADGETVLKRDRRPPVVYLRSFELDGRVDLAGGRYSESSLIPTPIGKFLDYGSSLEAKTWGQTVERSIADAFHSWGPVVSVGRPGELLAPVGSARIYYNDDEWRPNVQSLLSRAAVVIIQPWVSNSVIWEIDQALRLCDPRRVVLVFWEMNDEGYSRFHEIAAAAGLSLPSPADRKNGEEIVLFDEHRRSRMVLLDRKHWLGSSNPDLKKFADWMRTQLGGAHRAAP